MEKRQRGTEKALTLKQLNLVAFCEASPIPSHPQQMNFILGVKHCERPRMEPEYSDVKFYPNLVTRNICICVFVNNCLAYCTPILSTDFVYQHNFPDKTQ